MDTATKHAQKAALKIKVQENQEKMTKRIVAKETKAGNDLVVIKMADKRFYLKHKNLLLPE